MAKYRKIDPRIWNDEKFYTACLSCQHLFLFILTHPQMTPIGAIRISKHGLADELDWDGKGFPQPFEKAFWEGLEKGFWKYNERAKFLVVPNFINYNLPENPNVAKAWAKCLDDLPECDLRTELIQSVKGLLKGYKKSYQEAFAEGLGKRYTKTGAGAGAGNKPPLSGSDVPDEEFHEDLFDEARKHGKLAQNDNRHDALKSWKARLRAGEDPQALADGWRAYWDWCQATDTLLKHQKTFYGPARHWEGDFTAPVVIPKDLEGMRALVDAHRLEVPPHLDRDIPGLRRWIGEQLGMAA